jgi:hypothetical protein
MAVLDLISHALLASFFIMLTKVFETFQNLRIFLIHHNLYLRRFPQILISLVPYDAISSPEHFPTPINLQYYYSFCAGPSGRVV